MKTYGRLTCERLPSMMEAIQTDLEQGSHNLNNIASKEFAEKYPTIIAVAYAIDARIRRLESMEVNRMDVFNQMEASITRMESLIKTHKP